MMDLLGRCLLLAGCTALGLARGMALKERAACLAEFRRCLARLTRELTFSLRPLPDLVADLVARGPAGDFFTACRESTQETWTDRWQTGLEETNLPLKEEDRQILRETGEVLGRYDGESQSQALEGLLARLEENLDQARADQDRLFRVYLALGVTAGLFGCLLL
ncbi:MAG: stage III sporulation protein AB [Ruminiclostridium sp.]|nr:stage III sporulation protein AB [Ruminiclostridium sp.]